MIEEKYRILISRGHSYLKHQWVLATAIALLAGDKWRLIPISTQRTPWGTPSVAAVACTSSPCCSFIKTMILVQLFSYWPIFFYYCYLIMQGNLQVMLDSQTRRGPKKIHLKLVYVKGWITVWHKQTAQHIILFTWDQRTFVSLSPEGDTCSNNVQTSFAQGSELQEKGREKWVLSVLWERNLVMGNWCCSTLQYFVQTCRCMFSFVFLERVQPIAGDLCSSIRIKEPLYLSQIYFNFYFLDSYFHQKKK